MGTIRRLRAPPGTPPREWSSNNLLLAFETLSIAAAFRREILPGLDWPWFMERGLLIGGKKKKTVKKGIRAFWWAAPADPDSWRNGAIAECEHGYDAGRQSNASRWHLAWSDFAYRSTENG